MRAETVQFQKVYRAALNQHLLGKPDLKAARSLGKRAIAAGLELLDVARIHDKAVTALTSGAPSLRRVSALIRKAGSFFAEVITPMESNHRSAREAAVRLSKLIETLDKRTIELAASNRELKQEVARRSKIAEALRKSERHYAQLLKESAFLQEQLRLLSHRVLSTQEEERKRISRELHDQIAASLSGIHIGLASLKSTTAGNNKTLRRKISRTQKLVQESVEVIHAFARDLRPTTLDDLGLIPALHTFIKSFFKQTGIRAKLTVASAVETLDNQKRTVLYRVIQEAMTNVLKHARATQVSISIEAADGIVSLRVKDDGKSFRVGTAPGTASRKRLGLLGMRERVEMVGGNFHVQSAPGQGTTILAAIPMNVAANGKTRS